MEKRIGSVEHFLYSPSFLGPSLGPSLRKLIWRSWKKFREQSGLIDRNGQTLLAFGESQFYANPVDHPLNKPLRRGGNIVNLDGGKTWVTFKYERLPCFCFQCGLLGHDERHCVSFSYCLDSPKQYGDWLKAGGNTNGGSEKSRVSSSGGLDNDRMGKSGEKSTPVTANSTNLKSDRRAKTNSWATRHDK